MKEEKNIMIEENRDVKDLLLYRLLDCQSEEDHEKMFTVFEKIRVTFGDKVYYKAVDEMASFMREFARSNYDPFLMHLYQGALNIATRELIGPECTFENWDDQLASLKGTSFHWEYKFETSDFDMFKLDPHKVIRIVKRFNDFLHGQNQI